MREEMATDLDYVAALTEQLVSGFDERVHYALKIRLHTQDCIDKRRAGPAQCDCPETTEQRAQTVRHAPLITQLQDAIAEPATGPDNGGRSATRVDSSMPGNLEALELIEEIKRTLSSEVRRARQILGYDVRPSSIIRGAFCGNCSGALRLQDGKAVCIGHIGETDPCGTEYTWQQIEDYFRGTDPSDMPQ